MDVNSNTNIVYSDNDSQTHLRLHQPPLILNSSEPYLNDYGCIRSAYVRRSFNYEWITLNQLVDLFKEWRDNSEYFIIKSYVNNYQNTLIVNNEQDPPIPYQVPIYRFCKCAKRGNDVYQFLVNRKLQHFKKLPKKYFFLNGASDKKTPALFLTLTYDQKLFSLRESWKRVGKDWNNFITKLRKKYGKIDTIRTWEAHKSGYPHIHATLIFSDHKFVCFETKNNKGRLKYGIPKKDNDFFHEIWHSKIVEVEGLQSLHHGVSETLKYITKTFNNKKGDLTQALCWMYRKQAYSVSKDFLRVCGLPKLDVSDPKPMDLLMSLKSNSNDEVWEFVGILSGSMLELSKDVWYCELKKPPPQLVRVMDQENARWTNLRKGRR